MRFSFVSSMLILLLLSTPAFAAGPDSAVQLIFRNDGFVPATLHAPAETRIEIRIKNARTLPSEFESYDLGSEKVIPGDTTLSLWVGPLKPGKYGFFDDFNPGIEGTLVVGGDQQDDS